MSDLELAAAYLHEHECSVVAFRAGACLGSASGPGVAPFLRLQADVDLCGAALADRVVGRGIALVCVALGVTAVATPLASVGAAQVLADAGIALQAERVVPIILNRAGNGPCPTEALVAQVADPAAALPLLQAFVRDMRARQTLHFILGPTDTPPSPKTDTQSP